MSYDNRQSGNIVTIVLESFLQCFMLCSLFLQLFLTSCVRAISSFGNLYAPWISSLVSRVSVCIQSCHHGAGTAVVLLLSFPLSSCLASSCSVCLLLPPAPPKFKDVSPQSWDRHLGNRSNCESYISKSLSFCKTENYSGRSGDLTSGRQMEWRLV